MNNKYKKILAFFLACIMFFAVNSTVFAEENVGNQNENQVEESDVEEADTVTEEVDIEEEVTVKEEEESVEEVEVLGEEIQATASSTVLNVDDLVNALTNATDGDVITLDSNFVSSDVTLSMPNINATIDGAGYVWRDGSIVINGSGTGSLTIQNIDFSGETMSARAIRVAHTNGQLILNEIAIHNTTNGAMEIVSTGNAVTKINYSRFYDNSAYIGGTLYLNSPAGIGSVEINYSTFENNGHAAAVGGYEAGAISAKLFVGNLTINNTEFKNNRNGSANTGIYGGGGGAIEMHYMIGGTLNISQSYFYGNETAGTAQTPSDTYDGGAIYVFDGRDGSVVNIDQTTFDSNVAVDDGGAIMFQGTGNPGLTTNITNSTFIDNQAYGFVGAAYSGGAIQYFKNGGTSQMTNSLIGNTFVGNIAGHVLDTAKEQRGGAYATSGSSLAASVSMEKNLLIGNQVYKNGVIDEASAYKDMLTTTVSVPQPEKPAAFDPSNSICSLVPSLCLPTPAGTKNIYNADGANGTESVESVLGVNNAGATSNLSGITAGYDKNVVPTVPIKPRGIADSSYNGTTGIPNNISLYAANLDQRGYSRETDIGAVDMAWLAYHANGGVFNLPELTSYVGTEYYEGTQPEEYFSVLGHGGSGVVLESTLNIAAPEGKVFVGWSTDPNAAEPDSAYAPGTTIVHPNETFELYAVYAEEDQADVVTYVIKYVDEQGNEIAPSIELSGEVGTAFEVSAIDIDNYALMDESTRTQAGIFTSGDHTITFVYRRVAEDIVEVEEEPKEEVETGVSMNSFVYMVSAVVAAAFIGILLMKRRKESK